MDADISLQIIIIDEDQISSLVEHLSLNSEWAYCDKNMKFCLEFSNVYFRVCSGTGKMCGVEVKQKRTENRALWNTTRFLLCFVGVFSFSFFLCVVGFFSQ